MCGFNHKKNFEVLCERCGRKEALWNGLCADCLEEQRHEDEIVEARQDVLEYIDRRLREFGVEEYILNVVWDSASRKFGLGETV